MEKPAVVHSTFVLERTYPAPPERVFAAFANPESKRRWFAEGDSHDLEHFELDFRVDGKERAKSRFKPGTPIQGLVCESESTYLAIIPGKRIVQANTMSLASTIFSASLVTVELLPTEAGTEVILTHQGAFFEGADGPQIREMGWRKIMDRLAAEF